MCPLRYLPASLAPPFLSRSLSFCIIRVAARCAHLRKRARPKSARVYGSVQKKKMQQLAQKRKRTKRARQAYGLEQHRTVHVHVHRSRTDREPGKRQGRGAARSLAFTRSVSRWKHLRYREADLNRCREYRCIVIFIARGFMIPNDDFTPRDTSVTEALVQLMI